MSFCKFNTQGDFTCNEQKPIADTRKTFEKFSIASDAVLAYAANKCPDNHQKNFVQMEQTSDVCGYDPLSSSHQKIH